MQAIARSVITSDQTERHQGQGRQQKKTQATAGLLAIEGTPEIGDTLAKGGTPETVGNPCREPTAQEYKQKTTEMLPVFICLF